MIKSFTSGLKNNMKVAHTKIITMDLDDLKEALASFMNDREGGYTYVGGDVESLSVNWDEDSGFNGVGFTMESEEDL